MTTTDMTQPPASRFEFVAMASARARQLLRGCTPRVASPHKPARTAVREVEARALWNEPDADVEASEKSET
jgi:DNA-directed RNA polymerase subunit K/omega